MGIYLAPKFQNNTDLREYTTVRAEVLDIKLLHNQKWGSDNNKTITEITFKTECGHIVVQKEVYSLGKATMLNRLYNTITGFDIDSSIGFHTDDILNTTIQASVNKYKGNGYEGTLLIDFQKNKIKED